MMRFSFSVSRFSSVLEHGFSALHYGQQLARKYRMAKDMISYDFKVGKAKVRLVKGDITEMETDAIVNAANSSLMGGGGVDGAIHRKGGSKILEECKKIRATVWPEGLPTGRAVITSAGNLKAKHVIHTVGPVWHGGNRGEAELLAQAYQNSLRTAVSNKLKTVAFPSISTGAYGYPIGNASRIALKTVKDFLEKEDGLSEVIFVLFSEHDLKLYVDSAKEAF
jgi:O-acetyl-ADP-ribose deacetylase (regulator of RNase III)